MKRTLHILLLGILAVNAYAQQKGFTVKGHLNMPDSTTVGVLAKTADSPSEEVASGYIINGTFELKGSIGQPQPGTFITNNLELVEKNHLPIDSIRWTYTSIFLSDDEITVTPDLKIKGGEIQDDFNEYLAGGEDNPADPWEFIESHPKSVISVWLAIKLMESPYSMQPAQVEKLESTIKGNPLDPERFEEFKRRIVDAKKTTVGSPLLDLPVYDVNNKEMMLSSVLPEKKYVLIDFWASWCSICLHAMPEIKKIAEKHSDILGVIGLSIDEKEPAWRNAMERNPEPWAQYRATKEGYRIIFDNYQLGAGVPYYLLLDSEGKVICSPSGPEEMKEILAKLIQ